MSTPPSETNSSKPSACAVDKRIDLLSCSGNTIAVYGYSESVRSDVILVVVLIALSALNNCFASRAVSTFDLWNHIATSHFLVATGAPVET
jgi:hypothetical protein